MTITIYDIKIPKSTIEQMAEHERKFFIISGHILNEINFFGKIFLWSSLTDNLNSKLQDHVSVTQKLASAKVLAGKLFESWNVIQKLYFQSRLSKETNEFLREESLLALKELKKYFGNSSNLIATIRNKFSFHYDYNALNSDFSAIPENEDWNIYLSEQNSNSLYYLSEMVVNRSMLTTIDSYDPEKALNQITVEVNFVWDQIVNFLSGYIIYLNSKYFQMNRDQIHFMEGVNLLDVIIPYFVKHNNELK